LSERRLNIVLPQHELRGHAPQVYERLARTCRPRSQEHLGLVRVAYALAQRALVRCLPPSALQKLGPNLEALQGLLSSQTHDPRELELARAARAASFAVLPTLETLTIEAVLRAEAALHNGQRTSLHDHAAHTLARMLGLSVHHAVGALCHTLDALDEPEAALSVPSDTCGALAYSRTALGSVRNPAFQAAALEQARFEANRTPRLREVPLPALEVQVFHEYLGARWRAHGDEERRASDEFIGWAVGAR